MHRVGTAEQSRLRLGAALTLAISPLDSFSSIAAAADIKVTLAGDREVPPVKSTGAGTGTIITGAARTVSGSVTSTGIARTAAHIHEAASGKTGLVVVPLTKDRGTFAVPAGATLTDTQFASFQAGHLYVNVHTAAGPGCEIRGQLKP